MQKTLFGANVINIILSRIYGIIERELREVQWRGRFNCLRQMLRVTDNETSTLTSIYSINNNVFFCTYAQNILVILYCTRKPQTFHCVWSAKYEDSISTGYHGFLLETAISTVTQKNISVPHITDSCFKLHISHPLEKTGLKTKTKSVPCRSLFPVETLTA
jgi:hypothetical protein